MYLYLVVLFKSGLGNASSIEGHEATNALVAQLSSLSNKNEGYRILLIDALGFAWYPITVLRAVAVPGWEEKVTIPLTTERVFQAGTPHQVIAPNKVMGLREASIILEHPFEGTCEIPFFRCIIATGASQAIPTMPDPRWSEGQFKEALRKSQEDIAKATKVVVVGGGAVGIEIAGEIKYHHPQTAVTIVHKDIGLMAPTSSPVPELVVDASTHSVHASTPSTSGLNVGVGQTKVRSWSAPPTDIRLSIEMEKICQKVGIDVKLSDRVILPCDPPTITASSTDNVSTPNSSASASAPTAAKSTSSKPQWDGTYGLQRTLVELTLKSGQTLEADYVYPGCGMKPNSGVVRDVDPQALESDMIAVDQYLRVKSTNPASIFSKGQYYAIGDVAATPGYNIAHNAFTTAHRASGNVINEMRGKPLVRYSPGAAQGIGVPIGPNEGAGQFTIPISFFGNWTSIVGSRMIRLQRGKSSGTERFFAGRFKGSEKCVINFDDV